MAGNRLFLTSFIVSLLLQLSHAAFASSGSSSTWVATLKLATAGLRRDGAIKLCYNVTATSRSDSSVCVLSYFIIKGLQQGTTAGSCGAVRSRAKALVWKLDGTKLPSQLITRMHAGKPVMDLHLDASGLRWQADASTKHLCVAMPLGGKCSNWASFFNGARNFTYTLTATKGKGSSGNSAAGCSDVTGAAATGLPPRILKTLKTSLMPQAASQQGDDADVSILNAMSITLPILDPTSGVVRVTSAPVTQITAVTEGMLGDVTILPGNPKAGTADRLQYVAKAGAGGFDVLSYTVQAADGYQASGLAYMLVNRTMSSLRGNQPPTPQHLSILAFRNKPLAYSIVNPLTRLMLDPNTKDAPNITVTSVTQPRVGAASVVDNFTTVLYSPATNYTGEDVFRYTLSDGKRQASARINITVGPAELIVTSDQPNVDPCASRCDPKHIKPSEAPEASSGVLGAAAGILTAMSRATKSKPPSLFSIGLGIITGIFNPKEPSAKQTSLWLKSELEKDMSQMEDYLVCQMNAIVGNAFYSLSQQMKQDHIDSFNAAINGVQSFLADGCGARNCLNYTQMLPSQRNAASGNNCMMPHTSSDCSSVTTWNPAQPVSCAWADSSGSRGTGICDPIDKKCYESKVSFQGVINYFRDTVVPTFIQNSAINYFHAFDKYESIDALTAVAKGAALYVALLQELILLGSPGGENATMIAFAGNMADYLSSRYKYHTDFTRLKALVDQTSFSTGPMKFNDDCSNGGCDNCWSVPEWMRTQTCCTGDQCHTLKSKDQYGNEVWTGNLAVRQGCGKDYKRISCDALAWGTDKGHNCYDGGGCINSRDFALEICSEYWCNTEGDGCKPSGRFSCPCGPYDFDKVKLNGTQALQKDIMAQLANVSSTITSLRDIANGGMPADTFGFYQTQYYPLGACVLGDNRSGVFASALVSSAAGSDNASPASTAGSTSSTGTSGVPASDAALGVDNNNSAG